MGCDPIVDGVVPGASCNIQNLIGQSRAGFWNFEHFNGDATALSPETGYSAATAVGGAALTRDIPNPDEFGVATLDIPAGAAGDGARLTQANNRSIGVGGFVGKMGAVARVSLSLPPVAADDYLFFTGLTRSTFTEGNDGIWYRATQASANWILVHRRAAAETTVDTGVAIATATHQTLAWEADITTGLITAYVDGAPSGSMTPANIQPAQTLASNIVLNFVGVRANAIEARVDYIAWGCCYGTLR